MGGHPILFLSLCPLFLHSPGQISRQIGQPTMHCHAKHMKMTTCLTLIRPPMSRGNSPSERKRSNYFSFKQITSHSPVGSRSSLISARVQEQVLHQTLIEVP